MPNLSDKDKVCLTCEIVAPRCDGTDDGCQRFTQIGRRYDKRRREYKPVRRVKEVPVGPIYYSMDYRRWVWKVLHGS